MAFGIGFGDIRYRGKEQDMAMRDIERTPSGRRPSEKVRVAAARVRVDSDRQVGCATPQWIKDLAGMDKKR